MMGEREGERGERERYQSNGSVIIWTSVLLSLRSSRTDVDCLSSGIKSWKLFFFLCHVVPETSVKCWKWSSQRNVSFSAFVTGVNWRNAEVNQIWQLRETPRPLYLATDLIYLFVCFFPHLSSVSQRKSSVTNTGSQPLFLIRSNRPRWRQCFISTSTNKVPGSTPS